MNEEVTGKYLKKKLRFFKRKQIDVMTYVTTICVSLLFVAFFYFTAWNVVECAGIISPATYSDIHDIVSPNISRSDRIYRLTAFLVHNLHTDIHKTHIYVTQYILTSDIRMDYPLPILKETLFAIITDDQVAGQYISKINGERVTPLPLSTEAQKLAMLQNKILITILVIGILCVIITKE